MTSADIVRSALRAADVEFDESVPGTFIATLPGTAKLKTTCSLVIGDHGVTVNAFVARCPDENHAGVYRWLLERNLRTYGVAFAVDHLGDIYLAGRIPHESVTADEVDRLLGSVLQEADSSFNRILELGFVSAIRKEWAWREKRGEPLTNLAAFAHLAVPRGDPADQ
jgi:Putative bacterial sensory transduction regulator